MEFVAKRRDEQLDVCLRKRHDEVHVQRRAGFAADRAGQRPSDEVAHAAGLECLGNSQRDVDWICNQAQVPSRMDASG